MALRFDTIRLDADKIQRIGSGAVRVPGLLTRSAVFEYKNPDGSIVREWRPPEEVLKADSIATLKDLPVTERHPSQFVSPQTWKQTAIGHVSSETVRADKAASGVDASLVVSDGNAIPRIGTELKEISCGYQVDVEDSAGVVPAGMPDAGKPYDRVQRNIKYNHVAIGPAHWGRQGSTVALRLDSSGDEVAPACCDDCQKRRDAMYKCADCGKQMTADAKHCDQCGAAMPNRTDADFPWDECMAKAMKEYGSEEQAKKVCGAIKARNDAQIKDPARLDSLIRELGKENQTMFKIKIDQSEITAATEAELQTKIDAHFATRNDAAKGAELEKANGKITALEKQLADEKKRADEAPALVRKQIEGRTKLEAAARSVLGASAKFEKTTKQDGKDVTEPMTDREIQIAVIHKCDSAFVVDGVSDAKIEGAYETWVSMFSRKDAKTNQIALGLNQIAPNGAPLARQDASDPDEPDADAARARQLKRFDAKPKTKAEGTA